MVYFIEEDFVQKNFKLLCNMEQSLKRRIAIIPPYVPKEKGFPKARFLGRYYGFFHATMNDVHHPRITTEKAGKDEEDNDKLREAA